MRDYKDNFFLHESNESCIVRTGTRIMKIMGINFNFMLTLSMFNE